MRNFLKNLIPSFIAFLIIGTILAAGFFYFRSLTTKLNNQSATETLPDNLKLKSDKSKIIGSRVIEVPKDPREKKSGTEKMVEYYYISGEIVPAENLGKSKEEIAAEIANSEKPEVLKEVYDNPAEDIAKRTGNTQQYKVGMTEDNREIWKAKVYSGDQFYKEGDGWQRIERATTTEAAFNDQMRPTLADQVRMFFGQQVYADTIYSGTGDGRVSNTIGDWSSCSWPATRDATSGSYVNTDGSYAISWNYFTDDGEWYDCYVDRSFFYYDLSALSGTVTAVAEKLYGYVEYGTTVLSSQKGTQATTLAVADFDSFSGSAYGTVSFAINAYNTITYNAAGISDVQAALGGTHKTCVREYTYDYQNSDPGGTSTGAYIYSTDQAGTANDPYLDITIDAGPPPTPSVILENNVIFRNDVILKK